MADKWPSSLPGAVTRPSRIPLSTSSPSSSGICMARCTFRSINCLPTARP